MLLVSASPLGLLKRSAEPYHVSGCADKGTPGPSVSDYCKLGRSLQSSSISRSLCYSYSLGAWFEDWDYNTYLPWLKGAHL